MTTSTLSTRERDAANAALGKSPRWRQTVGRIVTEHLAHTHDQLCRCLNQSVTDVVAHPTGGLTIVVAGHQLHLADVCVVAQHEMVHVSRGPCSLSAGGRYGRFWWLAITQSAPPGPPRRALALGSKLSIIPSPSGHTDTAQQGPDPSLSAPAPTGPAADWPLPTAHHDGPSTSSAPDGDNSRFHHIVLSR